MNRFEYAIIGHGAAAFAAAIKANSLNIKTVMIGKNETKGTLIGGTCVNVGCVPSKRLITIGEFIDEIKKNRYEGIKIKIENINFKKIIEQTNQLVNEFRNKKYSDVLKSLKNVTYINEFGSFKSKNILIAGKEEIYAKKILIASGARANIPKLKGIENIKYLTNEEALSIKKLPNSMIIIGGRAIGLEFAQMFAHFGIKIILLQRSKTIIPNWEPEIINLLSDYLRNDGISINTGVELIEVNENKEKKYVKTKINGINKIFEADEILFATGRKPNIEKLKLENIGINLNKKGFIKINKLLMTNIKEIYAAGDVVGNPMLETLAAKEGNIATQNAFTKVNKKINLLEIPSAIFTMPEAAKVGYTDIEANKNNIKCNCTTIPLSLVAKADIIGDKRGLIKIVINNKTHRIIGTSILSRNAADIIAEASLAIKFKLTIEDIVDTVYIFPTLSEVMKLGAQNFYQDIEKLSCCTV